jgi:2-keto-4-pentenoate hydratase/2-oxohepta-3-ene-1,7-dioic acid hydratase in catechol pathway
VVVSGTPVPRPYGQFKDGDDVVFGPTRKLDYELELAFYVAKPTRLGQRVAVAEAADYIFGVCPMNDWSARDIQGYEMFPLVRAAAQSRSMSLHRPCTGTLSEQKVRVLHEVGHPSSASSSTATTVSPWVTTLDALALFKSPLPDRLIPEPDCLAASGTACLDIRAIASIVPEGASALGVLRCVAERHPRTGGKATKITDVHLGCMYWSLEQLVAHQYVRAVVGAALS